MKRKEVIFLLAMLLVGTSVGGFAYPSNCYAATAETESSSEQSIYSLANHYFKIKSTINGWSVPIWRGKECWYISA